MGPYYQCYLPVRKVQYFQQHLTVPMDPYYLLDQMAHLDQFDQYHLMDLRDQKVRLGLSVLYHRLGLMDHSDRKIQHR